MAGIGRERGEGGNLSLLHPTIVFITALPDDAFYPTTATQTSTWADGGKAAYVWGVCSISCWGKTDGRYVNMANLYDWWPV